MSAESQSVFWPKFWIVVACCLVYSAASLLHIQSRRPPAEVGASFDIDEHVRLLCGALEGAGRVSVATDLTGVAAGGTVTADSLDGVCVLGPDWIGCRKTSEPGQ